MSKTDEIFSNHQLAHTKLISAEQIKIQCDIDTMREYNKVLSAYIDYFNRNYIVDVNTSVVKCIFNEKQFPDFENQTHWYTLYTIFINSGYVNVRLSKSDMFYIIEADILNNSKKNSVNKHKEYTCMTSLLTPIF